MKKFYLGDGAYATLRDDGTIVLTAEDGTRATDTVVLEDFVFQALLLAVKRTWPDRLKGLQL